MPFEAETLLSRAVKEEVAKLALQRQATAETLAKYVDTSKADGLLYSQAKKFSAALDNEIKFWDKQSQIASKKQDYLSMIDGAQKQADMIMKISAPIAGIGAAITAPLLTFANAYLQSAGKTEVAGQRYQDAMAKLQSSEIRVGRQVTESLVPALEQAADLAEKISKYAEQHPEVVQGLVGLGAGASAIGTVGLSIGLLEKSIADIASLGAKLGLGAAGAEGAGAAATAAGGGGVAALAASIVPVAVTVLSLLAGAGIGKYIGDSVNQGTLAPKTGDLSQNVNDLLTNFKLVLSAATGGAGAIVSGGNKDTTREWAIAAEKFFGLIEQNTPTMTAATDSAKTFSDKISELNDNFQNSPAKSQIVESYSQYQDQLKSALENFNKSVTETQNQFAAAVTQENANYDKSVASAKSNYQKSSADADASYYAQREQAEEDHNKEMARMAQDHQRKLRDLQSSHDDRLNSLAFDRDASGIAQENASYAKSVSAENENYSIERKRSEENSADQLARMDANYSAQKSQRDAAYAEQLATLQVAHSEQLALLQQNETDKLATLQASYVQQTTALEKTFIERVRALDGRILSDYDQYQKALETMGTNFGKWLEAFNKNLVDSYGSSNYVPKSSEKKDKNNNGGPGGESSIGKMAAGGYTSGYGQYTMAENGKEFVMNDKTTSIAERMIGKGSLSQDAILSALGGGKSGSMNIQVSGKGLTLGETRKIVSDEISSNMSMLIKALQG